MQLSLYIKLNLYNALERVPSNYEIPIFKNIICSIAKLIARK